MGSADSGACMGLAPWMDRGTPLVMDDRASVPCVRAPCVSQNVSRLSGLTPGGGSLGLADGDTLMGQKSFGLHGSRPVLYGESRPTFGSAIARTSSACPPVIP